MIYIVSNIRKNLVLVNKIKKKRNIKKRKKFFVYFVYNFELLFIIDYNLSKICDSNCEILECILFLIYKFF